MSPSRTTTASSPRSGGRGAPCRTRWARRSRSRRSIRSCSTESTNRKFSAAPIVFGDLYQAGAEPRVLRVVEGSVRDGEFDRYVEEAEAGTRADAAAGRGPVTLYLARAGTNDFVTLSTWTEWDDVQDATGSDIRRPQATRHAERLAAWSASHFEIVGPEPAG